MVIKNYEAKMPKEKSITEPNEKKRQRESLSVLLSLDKVLICSLKFTLHFQEKSQ